MKREEEEQWADVCGAVVFIAIVFLGIGLGQLVRWHRAGLQAEQYQRQGISLTRWDCFMGVQPAETVIQLKPGKGEQ